MLFLAFAPDSDRAGDGRPPSSSDLRPDQGGHDRPTMEPDAALAADAMNRGSQGEVRDLSGDKEHGAEMPAAEPGIPRPRRRHTLPQRIGGYRILDILGTGGMGIVYRAVQERPHRPVALKVIRPGFVTPRLLRRFEYEAEVLGRLQHEGIARIYEAGIDEGLPYFAMELVEGMRLDDYVRQTPLSVERRLELLGRICRAVHYAHQKGVVHRDLKPANILVTPDGDPKILDFGVARLTDTDAVVTASLHTDTGQVVGTLAYMAPEQLGESTKRARGTGKANGEVQGSNDVDTRSDVYALGVIGYELLTGRLPLPLAGRPLPQALRTILEDEPTRLGTIDRNYRGDLETIIGKALLKEKERRYTSADDMAQDLVHYLRSEPIAARPASTWYYLGKFARRNKLLVGATVLLLLTLSLGLAGTTYGLIRAREESAEAQQQATAAREQAEIANAIRRYLIDALQGIDPVHADRGRPLNGVELVQHAVADIEKDQRFAKHPLVRAELYNDFGALIQGQGRPADAEPLYRKALTIYQNELGVDHLTSLMTLNNLGSALKEMDRADQAEPVLREAVTRLEDVQGPQGALTLVAMRNLGSTLSSLGRYPEAERILRQGLEGREQQLGPMHDDTLSTAAELGRVLTQRRKFEEAERLLRRALAGLERESRPPHPEALSAAADLGNILQETGRTQEVEALFRRSYEGHFTLWGADHPDTLRAAMNLGNWLVVLRKLGEAEPLLRRAADGYQRTKGAEHQSTLRAQMGLARITELRQRPEEAEGLYRQVLQVRERTLGPDHRETLLAKAELASVLWQMKRFEQAETMLKEVINNTARVNGPRHPDTLAARGNLAFMYLKSDRLGDAEALLSELMSDLEAVRGPDHPHTLVTAYNLATALHNDGRTDAAMPLYERAARGLRGKLGPRHPSALAAAGDWVLALDAIGQHEEADRLRSEFGLMARSATRPTTGPSNMAEKVDRRQHPAQRAASI